MGQRYNIHFKNYKNTAYDVKVYIDGYVGQVTELLGARSAFVVEGNDDNFVYEPIRSSTATLTLLGSDLLLDLFSINNQYAPVKLFKGDKLMWTGYIVPEQFTQPYKPTPDNISIDCISAIGTLENIQYEKQTENGFITAINLLRYIIRSANGGYEKIYIPYVYGSSEVNYSTKKNIFDEIILAEENFISEGMMLDEVLEYFCRFFNWTLYDYEGSLYFVDPDWKGEYFSYGEDLVTYEMVTPNTVLLQDIGFGGSDHTIDVLPGYNKVTVKAINNVFNELVENEEYDILEEIGQKYAQDNKKYDYKKFFKEKLWKLYHYDINKNEITDIESISDINKNVFGSVLMKEALFDGRDENGTIVPDVSDYPWTNCLQERMMSEDGTVVFGEEDKGKYPILQYEGRTAAWKDGAIGINYECMIRDYPDMMYLGKEDGWDKKNFSIDMVCSLRIGDKYWTGTGWGENMSKFEIVANYEGNLTSGWATVKNTKKPDMPYNGLGGYIIELPRDIPIIGKLEFTVYNYRGGIWHTPLWDIRSYGLVIKKFTLNYKKKDGVVDEGENGDRVYENVVNEKFMSELDEIEFGISSYNEDGATYSKALLNGNFLTNNLYSAIEGTLVRPEEALIRRIINRYRVTKIKLTQVLKNSDLIHPFTVLYDNSMVSKKFLLLSGVWDYEQNTVTLSMIENGDKVRYKNHK